MDFFERQDQARRNTKWLVIYFVLAVVLITLAVYAVTSLIFGGLRNGELWNPQLFAGAALGTLSVVFIGSVSKMIALRSGGASVAMLLGGVPLNPNSGDLAEQTVQNVVEEMAIASGTPVPQVYILRQEQGINAFAAGNSPSDAVIGVTRGCVELLDRDELQGVIAHEFSHILNGDMRLNLRLMGWVFGILCLTVVGRILLRTRGKKNPLPLLGLALIVIGWIGVFFGRLIQSAVSRQRELLADASAVQFTRNPLGLAGALKKIGSCEGGSQLESEHAEEASHLFFSNGLGDPWSRLMATHPPLEERIHLLDPTFDGKFPLVRPLDSLSPLGGEGRGEGALASMSRKRIVPAAIPQRFLAANALAHIGSPKPEHVTYATEFRTTLAPELAAAAREPMSAVALVYNLLLAPPSPTRTTQLQQLQSQTDAAMYQEMLRLESLVTALPIAFKLPLLSLTIPALTHLSLTQYTPFAANIQLLVECDKQVDVFEYVLKKIVAHHLESHFQPVSKNPIEYYALHPLLPDCAVLLSALARLGHDQMNAVQSAFRRGLSYLSPEANTLTLLDTSGCGLLQMDAALDHLSQSSPVIRKTILNACAETVAADGVIEHVEAELLRAIAETLDCPIPPFIEGV